MKLALTALALLSVVLVSCHTTRPLRTEKSVDLRRYVGLWYEIARLPNSFQRDDSRATAEYTLENTGTVHVVNTEYRPDGNQKVVSGQATVVPESNGSRLRVKFSGPAALVPVSKEGNYWIIAVSPDYSIALVGTPDRKFLWLLARRPDLPITNRQYYLDMAAREGFAITSMLIPAWPPQPAR